MFVQNKKFIISLVFLTMLGGLVFSGLQKKSEVMSEKEVSQFSQEFNKSLPVKINPEISLIKSQIGTVSPSIFSLDFFYAYYVNKADIKNFSSLTESMIYQTCQNDMTLSLLKRNVIIKHQFITLDKEKLPYIGVSIKDCDALSTTNKK